MLKPIKNKKEHKIALERIYNLMQRDLIADSEEAKELEILSILVEKYEEENYPIEPPHPIEAIKYKMQSMNLTNSELANILKYKSRVSEILSGKRKLSLEMIRSLNKELGISAETLIKRY
jgi:HTH-type transcriptional regulator/antitoxin HigA